MGRVYLTGAGPGDMELLTLKALRVIKEADVIIYDRLANPEILKMSKDGCEFVYVGKEDGRHIMPQDEINETIYQNALKYENVVRLKGGDPFVFGRGGEEILELKKHNIPYEVIPGITSAIAVPEVAGIPVTHRKVATSFTVVTGHEAEDKKEKQVDLSKLNADTIVILMGITNLENLVKELLQNPKRSKDTPVAIIMEGTTENQRVIKGTLGDIVEKAKKEGAKPPGVIVVGEVVNVLDS